MKYTARTRLLDSIDFADIKQFIDASLFTYSSGMKLGLGFAVAVHADPDILVLDEGLNAGDRTIIMVSHELDILKENCHTIAQMHKGSLGWPH